MNKTIVKKNLTLIIISFIGFFGIFTTTISKNPVLPLFVKSLNSPEAIIGLISAISPIAGIFFSFPVGFLGDKLGKKKMLIISSLVFILAPLLYLLVDNAWYLIPIRFFHGMATAILGPIAKAVICEEYEETKGEKLGIYSSVTLIGRTIAPIVGGALISFFVFFNNSWNFKVVYLLAFAVSFPTIFLVFFIKKDKADTTLSKVKLKDFFIALKTFLSEKRLFGTSLIEMSIYFTFGAFETYLPIYLTNKEIPTYLIGIIFSIQIFSLAFTKPFFGKLSDNIDRRTQIIIGVIILSLTFIIFPFLTNIILIIIVSIIFGIGMSLATVATTTYVADVAKKSNLGSSMGALDSIMDIGHSSGPFIVGMLITYFGYISQTLSYKLGFFSCFLINLISLAIFMIFNLKSAKKKNS